MAKPPRIGPQVETTPKQFPEVVPPSYADTVGNGWVVESMMQMQQAVGELKATTHHLTSASDKSSSKLDRISHVIFAAGVVLAIILAIGGFLLDKIWDGIVVLMKAHTG